jgi:transposase, IS5 family
MTARKQRPNPGFFDSSDLMRRVRETDHPLWRIKQVVDWERFRPSIDEVFDHTPKGPGGRPPYDRMMMFQMLVLKHLYNLSDQQMEQRLLGDLFFRCFLDLDFCDPTPDEKTIWFFHNQFCQAGTIFDLFDAFQTQLQEQNLIANNGIIVDATIVTAPVQHISKKEQKALDAGELPKEWKDNPAIASQRDLDAAWTKKHGKSYFGYKDHIKVDRDSKLILSFEVTPANDHDSQLLDTLIDAKEDTGQELHADAGYAGEPIGKRLRTCKVKDRRHTKAQKNKPLNAQEKGWNKRRSRIRVRVEHVFGAMSMQMKDIRVRTIGRVRATFVIGMRNLVYNICRCDYLRRARVSYA